MIALYEIIWNNVNIK